MKKLILLFVLALVIQSCCIKIVPPYRGSADFMMNLTSEQKNMVIWTSDSTSLTNLTNDGRIYAVNPKQLKELLMTKEKAMVYKWLPACTSENCISLGLAESYCNEKGIELYVVLDSYEDAFTQIESIRNPMFSKNVGYFQYETKDVDELFYKELLGDKYDKKNYYRFYYFENGEFIRTYETMTRF